MKKLVTPILTATLTATILLSSGLLASAQSVKQQTSQYYNQNEQRQKPVTNGNQPNGQGTHNSADKGAQNQLLSIDRQLLKIDSLIVMYDEKFNKMTQNKTIQKMKDIKAGLVKQAEVVDKDEDVEGVVETFTDYKGKFNSLSHRLDSIVRQLDSLASRLSDTSQLVSRYEKIEQLRAQLIAVSEKVNGVQKVVTDRIEEEKDAEVKPEEPIDNIVKPWRISFNKPLDDQALAELHVVVVDSLGNLIATDIVYDALTKSIIITPQQPYAVGERYTLFIDKNIKSHSGKTLKKSIKKTFYIR